MQLGNLEEIVLLILLGLPEDSSYGVAISEEYTRKMRKSISVPAIHTVLKRLQAKKLVDSKLGEPTGERGGKKKRIYNVTNLGYDTLKEIQNNRRTLWNDAIRPATQ